MTELISKETFSGLTTMTSDKLAKIDQRMLEINRASKCFNKKNTQTTSQLMTVTMLNDAPYRRLRQCCAEIQKKKDALAEIYFDHQEKKIMIEEWEEEGTPLSKIKADRARHQMASSKDKIDSALKEIAVFQEVYDEIKEAYNIPDDWDERDMEEGEIEHHLKMIFRLCFKDVVHMGRLGMGTMEYLEQYGLHAMTCFDLTLQYVNAVQDMIKKQDGMPTVCHFYDWLDKMAITFKDAYKDVLKRIGIQSLIKDEYLYMENNKNVS